MKVGFAITNCVTLTIVVQVHLFIFGVTDIIITVYRHYCPMNVLANTPVPDLHLLIASISIRLTETSTDHVGQAAGDDDVPGLVPVLTLGVRHQEAQLGPGARHPGHHLPLVLQPHAGPLHLQDLVPGLEARVVSGGVRLHAGDVALA